MRSNGFIAAFCFGALFSISTAFAAERTLTIALPSGFTSLDPAAQTDLVTQTAGRAFYEGLFGYDEKMRPVMVLAQSFEADKDGRTFTVGLKPGVKFHDGSTLTADAVKLNFDRVLDPKNALPRRNAFENIDRVEVVDERTVRFHLKRPFGAFASQLAQPAGALICPSAIKQYGRDVAYHICGTGPFVMTRYSPADGLAGKAFADYHEKGLPKVDGILWRPVAENATRVAMLKTGEAQVAMYFPPEQAEAAKKDPRIRVEAIPSIQSWYASINCLKKPFDDVRVRQALNYAVDKKALARVAFAGFADPLTGPVPKTIPGAADFGSWPFDPEKAKALLKEAGYEKGFSTVLWAAFNDGSARRVMESLQQQLRRVGVEAEVKALETGQRVSLVQSQPDPMKAAYGIYSTGWANSTAELDWALRPLLTRAAWLPAGANSSYYADPTVDKLIADAGAELDEAKRFALYGEAQKRIWDDAPMLFLFSPQILTGYSKDLQGVTSRPDGSILFYEAQLR